MPRIRFISGEDKGFIIMAKQGPGYGHADGTFSVTQGVLDAVRKEFEKEGVEYELVSPSGSRETHADHPQEAR